MVGVLRGALYFGGAPSAEDENGTYVRGVILNAWAGSQLLGTDHPDYPDALSHFARPGTSSVISTILGWMIKPYRVLVALSFVVSGVGLIMAVKRRDVRLAVCCVMPLCVVAFHILLLITINRYAVPAYPLLLANLIIVPSFLSRN